MRTTKYAVAAALALFTLISSRAVQADSITFDASGTFGNGSTLTGIVMIDTSDGLVTAVDLSVGSPGDVGPLTTFMQGGLFSGQAVVIDATGMGAELYLLVPDGSLIGYGGSVLCSTTSVCTVLGAFSFYEKAGVLEGLSSGELTEATTRVPAPEPSSMFLLVTGLLGLVGALRHKRLA
jgi:hypothetical protein